MVEVTKYPTAFMQVSRTIIGEHKCNDIAAFIVNDDTGNITVGKNRAETGDYILVDISDKTIVYDEPLAFMMHDSFHICVMKKIPGGIWIGKNSRKALPMCVLGDESEISQFLIGKPFLILKVPNKPTKAVIKRLIGSANKYAKKGN